MLHTFSTGLRLRFRFSIHIFRLVSHVSLMFRARVCNRVNGLSMFFFANHGLVWLEHFTRIVQTKARATNLARFRLIRLRVSLSIHFRLWVFEISTSFCFCSSKFTSSINNLWHTIYMSRFRARSLSQFPLHWNVLICDRIYIADRIDWWESKDMKISKHRPWKRRGSMLWFRQKKKTFRLIAYIKSKSQHYCSVWASEWHIISCHCEISTTNGF